MGLYVREKLKFLSDSYYIAVLHATILFCTHGQAQFALVVEWASVCGVGSWPVDDDSNYR